jgi:2-oxo-4-hydroxy-4-carboxy-5-ureidoimidazoline decarboxylase
MNEVLARWNEAPVEAAAAEILPCCGSMVWAREMASRRPFQDDSALIATSDDIWRSLSKPGWVEAFRSHPQIGESRRGESRIGGSKAQSSSIASSAAWAMEEQKKVADATDAIKIALMDGNREYEKKFGHIFIVCATGKSATEMLEILKRRMYNDEETELREAAEQQRQITRIRLRKWLRE